MATKDKHKSADRISLVNPSQFGTDELSLLTTSVLEDCLQNMIHDLVLEVHREEKIARARSAVIVAEEEAKKVEQPGSGSALGSSPASPDAPVRLVTPGAIYENGLVRLRGNPLQTTPEIVCARCRLPRLSHPATVKEGAAADPAQKYCARHPAVVRSGHDVWGQPFAAHTTNSAKAKKDKKEQEAKSQQAKDKATNASSRNASPPPSEAKMTVTFPSVKCPNCPRYLFVTRLASHLEKCMGLTGRNASRNAMAKMDSSQNRNSSTPIGSRLGTPTPKTRRSPGAMSRDEDDEEDDDGVDDEVAKKKKKKTMRKPSEKIQPLKLKKAKEFGGSGKSSPLLTAESAQNGVKADARASPSKRAREISGADEDTPKTKKAKRLDQDGTSQAPKMKELSSPKTASTNGTTGGKVSNGKNGGEKVKKGHEIGRDEDPFREPSKKHTDALGPTVEV
ncbi:MAG: hypothetical protein M1838_004483 [Thelocarpon superellum]|nr:MAG: hypothetical protein M1838_004483 [Thelocarpon superellum]